MKHIKMKELLTEDEHKIYVKKGQQPPKGKKLQKGPRGGQFFTGTAAEKEKYKSKDPYGQSPSNKHYGGPPPDPKQTGVSKIRQSVLDKLTDHYEEDYLDQGYSKSKARDAAEEMANDEISTLTDKELNDKYKEDDENTGKLSSDYNEIFKGVKLDDDDKNKLKNRTADELDFIRHIRDSNAKSYPYEAMKPSKAADIYDKYMNKKK